MFYQIFLSPQVKRRVIITYKHGIHELLHELPKDLSKNFVNNSEKQKLNFFRRALFHTKTRVNLKHLRMIADQMIVRWVGKLSKIYVNNYLLMSKIIQI